MDDYRYMFEGEDSKDWHQPKPPATLKGFFHNRLIPKEGNDAQSSKKPSLLGCGTLVEHPLLPDDDEAKKLTGLWREYKQGEQTGNWNEAQRRFDNLDPGTRYNMAAQEMVTGKPFFWPAQQGQQQQQAPAPQPGAAPPPPAPGNNNSASAQNATTTTPGFGQGQTNYGTPIVNQGQQQQATNSNVNQTPLTPQEIQLEQVAINKVIAKQPLTPAEQSAYQKMVRRTPNNNPPPPQQSSSSGTGWYNRAVSYLRGNPSDPPPPREEIHRDQEPPPAEEMVLSETEDEEASETDSEEEYTSADETLEDNRGKQAEFVRQEMEDLAPKGIFKRHWDQPNVIRAPDYEGQEGEGDGLEGEGKSLKSDRNPKRDREYQKLYAREDKEDQTREDLQHDIELLKYDIKNTEMSAKDKATTRKLLGSRLNQLDRLNAEGLLPGQKGPEKPWMTETTTKYPDEVSRADRPHIQEQFNRLRPKPKIPEELKKAKHIAAFQMEMVTGRIVKDLQKQNAN
jgi:hypothetical protein